MTAEQQRLSDYLAHIFEVIERIEHDVTDLDEPAFFNHKLVQNAVIRTGLQENTMLDRCSG